jgi:anti-sigma-K factor RskA
MTPDRDDSALAARYVLDPLDPEIRVEAEHRIASDPAFARLVESWRERLVEFDDTAEAVAPGAALWSRIEQDLAELAPAPRVPAPDAPRFTWSGLWSSLPALRAAAIGGVVSALVFAALGLASLRHAQDVAARKPVYVAILIDDSTKQTGAVVNAFSDGRVEMIPISQIDVPKGRVLQIWTLWDRAVGPRSVGVIDRARTTWLNLENLPATGADQLFEITLEPEGGSPIGRPTGPILYKGTTSRAL